MVDVPVRLKIDIGDSAIMLVGGNQSEAAVAGRLVHLFTGRVLRSPCTHLGSGVIRQRYLSDRTEEDISQIGGITLIVGTDGDLHHASVSALATSRTLLDDQRVAAGLPGLDYARL